MIVNFLSAFFLFANFKPGSQQDWQSLSWRVWQARSAVPGAEAVHKLPACYRSSQAPQVYRGEAKRLHLAGLWTVTGWTSP